jgi:hypothetical protein
MEPYGIKRRVPDAANKIFRACMSPAEAFGYMIKQLQ